MNEISGIENLNPWLTLFLAVLAGYFTGSVSFARIVNYVITGSWHFTPFREKIPGSDEMFESDLVSATVVSKNLGTRYGCLVSLLDMVKVALPTLAFRFLFPGQPFFLAVALAGMAGHIYPLWYRFHGGRGESPLLGALLVIDLPGILAANLAGALLGFLAGSVLVLRWGGYLLLIFWFWFVRNNPAAAVFMLLASILYFFTMRTDLGHFQALKRERGSKFSEEEVSRFLMMGGGIGRMMDLYSPPALFKRWRSSK